MAGTVASPTPTVPISDDSTTVIATGGRSKCRPNMAATIQPAVPPPATTILRTGSETATDSDCNALFKLGCIGHLTRPHEIVSFVLVGQVRRLYESLNMGRKVVARRCVQVEGGRLIFLQPGNPAEILAHSPLRTIVAGESHLQLPVLVPQDGVR